MKVLSISKSRLLADPFPAVPADARPALRNRLGPGWQSLLLFLLATLLTPMLFAAVVTTDKSDYPPGSTVQITGSGFQAGEEVVCEVDHSDGLDTGEGHDFWLVTADGSGNFTTTWYVNPDDSLGATLLLTATGQTSGLIATSTFTDAFGLGIAPVSPPTGGFAIDGNLEANVPTTGIGDWVPKTPGAGVSVLTSAGVPIDSANTFHLIDFFDTSENNFAGGLKYFDDPTTWTWVDTNKAPAKNDINHGLIHFTTDISRNIWVAVASDRLSDNGDAYIDFEFLQNPLTLTGTAGGTKGFASVGPDGGRTLGDFLLTLSLTQGGSVAGFRIERWENNPNYPGGNQAEFTYIDRTSSTPLNSVYAAVNTSDGTPVSFGAFGNSTYKKNTFVEGAVNLTALLGAIDPCTSLGIKTLLVKCKTSASPTATITDFIAPLQINKRIGLADAGLDQSVCSDATATQFALSGTAVPSPGDSVISTTWSVVPDSGLVSISDSGSLITTVTVNSPATSATLRLTVETRQGCTVTDDVILTVKPQPICSIEQLTPITLAGEEVRFRAPAGSDNYAWSVEYDGSGTPTAVGGNSPDLTFTLDAQAESGVLRLVVTNNNGCTSSCAFDLRIISPTLCIVVANPSTCPNENQSASLTGPLPPDTVITWAISPDIGTLSLDVSDDELSATIASTTCQEYTVTVTATKNGFASTCTTTGSFVDTTPPVISPLPGPSTIDCPAMPAFAVATATDNCGSAFTLTPVDVTTPGACAGQYSVTRTWTATDACGNVSTASQTINVIDTEAPVISPLPGPSTIACPATPVFAVATATDECGSVFTLIPADVTTPGACAGQYSVTRTWTATDACGNVSTASQTINVIDTEAPVISPLPGPSTIACPATPVFAVATATDECGSVFTLTPADVTTPGACAGQYSVTRTWTATDACGNVSTASQTINVIDTEAPVISPLPGPSTIDCPATPVFAVATATDECGSVFTLIPADVTTPGACAGQYSVTRTWTATDACGNVSTASQTINVIDTEAPVISPLPGPSTIDCPATPVFAVATATDECGSVFTLIPADVTTPGACAGQYSVTRTWTATDACGNVSTASQTINVIDTEAPVISPLPGPSTIACPATPVFAVATATDECGSVFTLIPADVTTPGACAGQYSVTRTWTATDACGNVSTASQTINVIDTEAPVISPLPGPSTIDCPATPVFAVATATDECGSVFTLIPADVTTPGACDGQYSVTRTWTATDACGNVSTASQTINVVDTLPPVIVCPPDMPEVDCTASTDPADTGSATATDECSGVTISSSDAITQGSCARNYVIARTWTATDDCGNTSSCVQTITVSDTTLPNPGWPANVNLTCVDCDINPATTGQPTVDADDCGTVTTSYEDVEDSGEGICPRIVKRLWTVTDGCNEVTATQIIQCLPTSEVVVTNSSLCTYDMDPSTECKDFRLLFNQDPKNFPKSKVTATNPGQTYYNLFYKGTAGSPVTFNITLPYPYVTQGAQPIHAYDWVTPHLVNGEVCYEAGRGFYVGSTQVMLDDYGPQKTYGSKTALSVNLTVPSTGFIYLNIHLDFGLKGSSGYSANSNGDAVDSTSAIVIPNRGSYTFSSSYGFGETSDSICNINVWKKLPGAGGFAGIPYTTHDGSTGRTPKAGCTAVLKDSKGVVLSSGVTDEDGWYFCNYKWTGKQATIYVTLTPPGSSPITRSATLKSNGYAQIDFDMP